MTSDAANDAKWLLSCLNEMKGEVTDGFAVSVTKSALNADLMEYLDDKQLLEIDWEDLSDEQRETLSDACYAVLCDNAPVLVEYELEQDFGPYPAYIRGVKGCYFLDIMERDPIGPFANVDLAKKAFELCFGEIILDDSE